MTTNNPPRPLFKGVLSALTTIFYISTFSHLMSNVPDKNQKSAGLYLLSAIGLFFASSLLHVFAWPNHLVEYLRKLDHTMIHINIFMTYYAYVSTVMPTNNVVLYILIFSTVFGILSRIFYTDANKIVIALPYILAGWACIFDVQGLLSIYERSPIVLLMMGIAGISDTLGAVVYATHYPKLWPKYFGYHELFHLLAVTGSLLFTWSIFGYAIPYSNKI